MSLRRRIDAAAAAVNLAGSPQDGPPCLCRPGGWAAIDLTGEDSPPESEAMTAAGVLVGEDGASLCARCGGVLSCVLVFEYDDDAPQDGGA